MSSSSNHFPPVPVQPIAITASHRVQAITPHPQMSRAFNVRPVSRSPTPFQANPAQRINLLEDIFSETQKTGSNNPPTNITLIARGISLLSINQLRDLLREYSLPTGGNKHILVNRLIIFLETFAINQPEILSQFSSKLKHLLSFSGKDEHPDTAMLSHMSQANSIPSNTFSTMQLFPNSPSCLFRAFPDSPILYGPTLVLPSVNQIRISAIPADFSAVLEITSQETHLKRIVVQIAGQLISMAENKFWKDVTEFANRQLTFQIVGVEPEGVSIIVIVRQLQKVPIMELVKEIIQKPPPPEILDVSLVSPICPLTRKVILFPARSIHCQHQECFDLSGFLSYSIKNNTWQCPICHKKIQPEEIRIDPNFFLNLKCHPA